MNTLRSILLSAIAVLFVQCEQVSVENDISNTYVEFTPKDAAAYYGAVLSYNFVYRPAYSQDTVWLDFRTRGWTPSHVNTIKLNQIKETRLPTGYIHAEEGKHYVPFSDEDLQNHLVVRSGETMGKIPVVLLRYADMKDNNVQLTFEIVANDNLRPGANQFKRAKIVINDGLTEPNNWNFNLLGSYGKVKHEFLIRVTGERFDTSYFNNLSRDNGLQNYLKVKLPQLLEEENQKRIAAGMTELRENDDAPFSKVEFPK